MCSIWLKTYRLFDWQLIVELTATVKQRSIFCTVLCKRIDPFWLSFLFAPLFWFSITHYTRLTRLAKCNRTKTNRMDITVVNIIKFAFFSWNNSVAFSTLRHSIAFAQQRSNESEWTQKKGYKITWQIIILECFGYDRISFDLFSFLLLRFLKSIIPCLCVHITCSYKYRAYDFHVMTR